MDAEILEGLQKILTGKIRHDLDSFGKKRVSQEPYPSVKGRLAIKLIIPNHQINQVDQLKVEHFKLEQVVLTNHNLDKFLAEWQDLLHHSSGLCRKLQRRALSKTA